MVLINFRLKRKKKNFETEKDFIVASSMASGLRGFQP